MFRYMFKHGIYFKKLSLISDDSGTDNFLKGFQYRHYLIMNCQIILILIFTRLFQKPACISKSSYKASGNSPHICYISACIFLLFHIRFNLLIKSQEIFLRHIKYCTFFYSIHRHSLALFPNKSKNIYILSFICTCQRSEQIFIYFIKYIHTILIPNTVPPVYHDTYLPYLYLIQSFSLQLPLNVMLHPEVIFRSIYLLPK